jgi:glutathione S-transferase
MHSGFTTLRGSCPMCCGIRVRIDAWTPELKHDVARIGELWSDGLNRFGGPFLAGKAFTAVDAFFAPVAFRAQTYGLTFGEAADAYAKRLLALPAMQSWEKAALAETWREPAHENDVKRTGTWLEDRRATA